MPRAKGKARSPAPAGTIVRASGKDGPQRVESDGHRWTDAAEAVFLDHFAASCNVTHAARACGFSTVAIYKRRRGDPGFAERWQAALEQGYARLESILVQRATDALEGFAPDPEVPIPPMTVKEALAVLQLHRASVKGEGARPGWRARPRSLDEMRDSILAKLSALEAAKIESGHEA